jgi:hypothetical protein
MEQSREVTRKFMSLKLNKIQQKAQNYTLGKNNLFNKPGWQNCILQYIQKLKSKCIENICITAETVKLLEENIGR